MSDNNPRRPARTRHEPEHSEAVGRAIKVLRAARGLSRKELAEAAGISYPYLSEIESGTKAGSSRALRPIAEALGVPLHELFAAGEELLAESPRSGPLDADTTFRPASMTSPAASRWFRSSRTPGSPDRRARLQELERLAESMSDEDVDRLLDLARRLSS
ncbi:MAG: helix-turn-helix transcriptional regulator [Dehalococcoidia bacterium]